MEAEDELLVGAKVRVQRLCHLRHKADKCPWIHSGGKVSQFDSIDVTSVREERKRVPVCVSTQVKCSSYCSAPQLNIDCLVSPPRVCLEIEH